MKANLYDWAAQAQIGATVVYHRGHLGTLAERQALAGARANKEGLVFLAHRKRPDGEGYDYEATRISRGTAAKLGLGRGNERLGVIA